jgi:glutathione S-transferase
MTLKLYYWPRSSATRVQWALEELGVPYEKARLDRERGENRTPEYLAISPQGNIPALVDGDAKIFESAAILIHLGQKYGVEKGLWPKSPGGASEALVWCVWSSSELAFQRLAYALQTLDAPFTLPKEDRNPKVAERFRTGYYARIAVLESRLAGKEYLAGNAFSLADVAVAQPVAGSVARLGLPIADYKNVTAWVERCSTRPAFQRVMAES